MVHAFIIEPTTYIAFENEAAQIDQCKEWGLLSEKASKTKAFFYKRSGQSLACSIIGYVDTFTAVIEFENGQRHCIHPSFLKEMQAANYGQKLTAASEEADSAEAEGAEHEGAKSEGVTLEDANLESGKPESPQPKGAETQPEAEAPSAEQAKTKTKTKTEEPSEGKAKKEKAQKLQLPEEKVKMTATIKEFTTVPNHFSDTDDEVIIYEEVAIVEPETAIGSAWSSHSATLKKLELEVGDTITFEAKIAAKKLTKHPVPYKINNPAKIQKS
ncbi:hypothetical protein [Paenibacillus sp. MBLB4367]|uniref:hypothetical protein n=1 Tax=Paenibacillus sp. MBLB4367 TaxID=3384767 RepID=UPI0039083089